jgi:hypothetical protein
MLYPGRVEEESRRQSNRHTVQPRLVVEGSESRRTSDTQKPEERAKKYVDPEKG